MRRRSGRGRSQSLAKAGACRPADRAPPDRPQQARRGPGLGRSHPAECERGAAAPSPRRDPWIAGRTSALLLANIGTEPRRPASPASLLGTGMSRRSELFRMLRDRRRSSWRSRVSWWSDSSPSIAVGEALQRQQLDSQGRSWRALFRLAKPAFPRRRRPACSPSSDSGVFSAPAAMPAPRAKRGRAGHDVSASLGATGLSTVVLKPFLSLAVL